MHNKYCLICRSSSIEGGVEIQLQFGLGQSEDVNICPVCLGNLDDNGGDINYAFDQLRKNLSKRSFDASGDFREELRKVLLNQMGDEEEDGSFANPFTGYPFSSLMGGGNQTHRGRRVKGPKKKGKVRTPDFLENLTSSKENFDDVYFRDEELNDVVRIMSRKEKNNPIIVGEPGVGKTVLIEHLAKNINDFPFLKDYEIYSFNISTFMSGTNYRGEFEKKFDQMMNYFSKRKIILFIDEIHQIIGAGSSEGSQDLNLENLLKPFLISNNLILIGATTPSEFRSLETDAAFLRRIQRTNLYPLTKEQTLEVLKKVKSEYESHHKVKIDEEQLKLVVDLSDEFLHTRNFPDKALDILDETMSFVRMSESEQAIENEEEIQDFISHFDEDLQETLKDTLINRSVSDDDVRGVVERISGVPTSAAFSLEDRSRVREIGEKLQGRVIGQDKAIKKITKALQRKLVQLSGRTNQRPIVLFLAGPTGVGKTETAKAIAETVLGDEDELTRFDMSEFGSEASINRLIGSPPGYVGHEEEGELTEAVRQNPFSVILLDEFEKASPDVSKLFLQLFDDGVLTDNKGRRVDFSNTIILLTSNIGSGKKENVIGLQRNNAEEKHKEEESRLFNELQEVYPPEFINRIDDFIVFEKLNKEDLEEIASLIINDFQVVAKEKGIDFKITQPAIKHLSEEGFDERYGARPLLRTIQNRIENALVEFALEDDSDQGDTLKVNINLSKDDLVISRQ